MQVIRAYFLGGGMAPSLHPASYAYAYDQCTNRSRWERLRACSRSARRTLRGIPLPPASITVARYTKRNTRTHCTPSHHTIFYSPNLTDLVNITDAVSSRTQCSAVHRDTQVERNECDHAAPLLRVRSRSARRTLRGITLPPASITVARYIKRNTRTHCTLAAPV